MFLVPQFYHHLEDKNPNQKKKTFTFIRHRRKHARDCTCPTSIFVGKCDMRQDGFEDIKKSHIKDEPLDA